MLGVAFFLLFVTLDLQRSLLTVMIGHTVIAIPFATLILLARLSGLDPALEDAAMDLGATYPAAAAPRRPAAHRARPCWPRG